MGSPFTFPHLRRVYPLVRSSTPPCLQCDARIGVHGLARRTRAIADCTRVIHKTASRNYRVILRWLAGEAGGDSHSRVPDCALGGGRLTPRWSQRRPPLEFMDGLSYTTVIEIAEPLARRRGSALDR